MGAGSKRYHYQVLGSNPRKKPWLKPIIQQGGGGERRKGAVSRQRKRSVQAEQHLNIKNVLGEIKLGGIRYTSSVKAVKGATSGKFYI